MTTLIKLGGSLITDKRKPKSFRRTVVQKLARQLNDIRRRQPELRLVVGHGSGAFGHAEAAKYNTVHGVRTAAERLGFARVGAAATELSQLVLEEFIAAGLPAMRFQPSSMLRARDRHITAFAADLLNMALGQGMLPLVHGDIALDEVIGGAIVSTESLFAALAKPLAVSQIVLLGDVAGVLDGAGALIPVITPASYLSIASQLGGSPGFDVTGGMLQKVSEMVDLVAANSHVNVVIADGNRADILIDVLVRRCKVGTRICARP